MVWHSIIYSICVGAFFGGLVLTILLLILSGANLVQNMNSIDDGFDSVDTDIGDASIEIDSSVEISSLEIDEIPDHLCELFFCPVKQCFSVWIRENLRGSSPAGLTGPSHSFG